MLALLVPLLLTAAPTVEDRSAEVEQGRLLIRDLKEEEALAILEPLAKDATLPARLRATALIYAGIASMNLARDKDARAHFSAALAQDPAASVPAWVSRKVRAVFEEVLSIRDEQRRRAHLARNRPLELQTVPTLPPPAPPRRTALTLGLAGGAVASAIAAGVLFAQWNALHGQANAAPSSREAESLQAQSVSRWYAAEACAGVAMGLAAGAVVAWTVTPSRSGAPAAAVSVSGRF